MFARSALAGAALLLGAAAPARSSAAARFDRYPATVASVRPVAPRLRTVTDRHYRTALRAAGAAPVDFAGHWTLAVIGCGAECLVVAAVDHRDGRVVWLRPTLCCWPDDVQEPLAYRRDSRLLVAQGMLDEREPRRTWQFVFDGRRFVPLAEPSGG